MKRGILGLLSVILITAGCSLDSMFQQPQVTVIDYELVELPGDTTKLLIECDIKNMDSHDGDVKSVTYVAVIEGVTSLNMTYTTPFTMKGNQTLRMKLPLTLPTAEAALLLDKLNAGKSLNYTVTGKFTADTFLGTQELSLNVSGTAAVEVGIEDFFIQPFVEMNETEGFYVTDIGSPPPPFGSNQPVKINIKEVIVSNKDAHNATVKQMVYTVNLEGVNSEKMTYTPSSPIPISNTGTPGAQIVMSNLPMNFSYASLIGVLNFAASGSYYVDYTIIGTVLIEADLGSGPIEFYLPVNTSGSNTLLVSP
jgi:LEA14-like dessication related protein